MQCTVDGCEKPAARSGLCWACLKQRQRKGTVAREKRGRPERHPTPRDMVLEACHNLEDATEEDDASWERAWHRLRMAMRRYISRSKRKNHVHTPPETT